MLGCMVESSIGIAAAAMVASEVGSAEMTVRGADQIGRSPPTIQTFFLTK